MPISQKAEWMGVDVMGGRGGSSGGANGLYYGNKALALEIDGQKIQDLISPYLGKYKYIGIRTQEEPFEIGDMQHQAVVWINGEDVATLMCLFKIARIATGRGKTDSFIDLAGYAACAGELATGGGTE